MRAIFPLRTDTERFDGGSGAMETSFMSVNKFDVICFKNYLLLSKHATSASLDVFDSYNRAKSCNSFLEGLLRTVSNHLYLAMISSCLVVGIRKEDHKIIDMIHLVAYLHRQFLSLGQQRSNSAMNK